MQTNGLPNTVDIRPGSKILSVLKHLNYKPWFAMAEFVDNAIQSYLDYKDELIRADGKNYKLKVSIEFKNDYGGRIIIRDNAAGIHANDYKRAFRPAEVPPDRQGLSEFGIGMKSASCWFAPKWQVRTSALYENVERIVEFDINKIVLDDIQELKIQSLSQRSEVHYTEITLNRPYNSPQGKTLRKMKEHLGSIYRNFLREGVLELIFDGEPLSYVEPNVLIAPFYKEEGKKPVRWWKHIEFDFGQGQQVRGFAALREVGSTTHAGFSLFRRKRLIQGSGDETYRPEYIFGKANSYAYQRLFGELELVGFEVSHTKDGFRWEEDEDVFLSLLEEYLNQPSLPLLDQANGYRARQESRILKSGAEKAIQNTAEVIRREIPPIIEQQIEQVPSEELPVTVLPVSEALTERELTVEIKGELWQIKIELSNDPSIGDWVSFSDQPLAKDTRTGIVLRSIKIRMSLDHPFMIRFGGTDADKIEPLLRIAAAIALAEISARESGVKHAGTIKDNINDLLRTALSKT
jgi:hypothetical protein